MLVIGSTAIHQNDNSWRNPKDLDTVILDGEEKQGDCHVVPVSVYKALESYSQDGYLSIEGSYYLKVSHAQFDVRWQKTATDIICMQKKYGLKEVPDDFHNVLYPFWLNYHKNHKHLVNMKQTPKEFFSDNVERKYRHDDLHRATMYYSEPLFLKAQYDNQTTVETHKELFDALSFQDQLRFVREECYVVALERFILTGIETHAIPAYRKALKKLVTTMTEGWFPRFMLENLNELKSPEIDYIEKAKQNGIS